MIPGCERVSVKRLTMDEVKALAARPVIGRDAIAPRSTDADTRDLADRFDAEGIDTFQILARCAAEATAGGARSV